MTNGGLETTRSNSSPATGSSSEPRRRLTRSSSLAGSRCSAAALSSRLKRVNARARSEMSVAVTCSAWCSRWKVWMPQPVPRSRARGHVPPDGGLHQGGGRLADAQHMVVAQDARALVRGEVAGHPQVRPAAADCSFAFGRRPSRRAAGPALAAQQARRRARAPAAPAPAGPRCGCPEGRRRAVRSSCGSARSQSRTTAASAAVVSPPRARPVTISAGISWSRLRAECAASPSSSATPSTV